MPRPKGAGNDPRFGRLSSRILDDILYEYDSGERARFMRRVKQLERKAWKMAMSDGGCESFGPNGPTGPPPALVAAQALVQLATVKKLITEVRREEQKIDSMVTALFHGLEDREAGGDDEQKRGPAQIVVKYAAGVSPESDGDPA